MDATTTVHTSAKGYNIIDKPHFEVLDGLRGVAALMVVAFHLLEAHAQSPFTQLINHGYLAVDFFFLLSGFVIGYAYDNRWTGMSTALFFKRRLIRLQPMVIVGMILGAVCFYFQDSVLWPNIHTVPVWKVILYMLVGFTLIPMLPAWDIRGWAEMYPLDGPGWTLFFEYIGNFLYGMWVRKFSKTALWILVVVAAALLVHVALKSSVGNVVGGWALEPGQFHIGIARLLYPFFAGLLLFRTAKLTLIKNGFLWCSLLVVLLLSLPYMGNSSQTWINGLYDSLCIILVFPLVVYMGASSKVESAPAKKLCRFLGDISYPIYITHYPLVYIYTAWVANTKTSLHTAYPIAIAVFAACIAVAYFSLTYYDLPVRKWLSKKYLQKA
jgi:peptidoglycan/LPS O-acetylase OafA/YrhL